MKTVIGIILLIALTALPLRAQCPYARRSSSGSSSSSHSTVVSGSDQEFVPSTFEDYNQALALGSASPVASHAQFLNFDQAIQKALAENAAKLKTAADFARDYQNAKQQQKTAPAQAVQQHRQPIRPKPRPVNSAQALADRILSQ